MRGCTTEMQLSFSSVSFMVVFQKFGASLPFTTLYKITYSLRSMVELSVKSVSYRNTSRFPLPSLHPRNEVPLDRKPSLISSSWKCCRIQRYLSKSSTKFQAKYKQRPLVLKYRYYINGQSVYHLCTVDALIRQQSSAEFMEQAQ